MTVIPSINAIGVFAIITSAVVAGVSVLCWLIMDERDRALNVIGFQGARTYLKYALPIAFVSMLLPSKETSWYIVGAYAAQTVATSEFVGEVAGEGKEILLELMQKARTEAASIDLPELAKPQAKDK